MITDIQLKQGDGWGRTDAFSGASGEHQPEFVRIVVQSNPDAEIFLIRYDLSLAANDVGRLETSQPGGLYKLRVMRGDQMREALIEASGDGVEHTIMINNLATVGPSRTVLGPDETTFLARIGSAPVRRMRQQTIPVDAAPTKLLVMGSETFQTGNNPLSGIRVRPWREHIRAATLARERKAAFAAGSRLWSVAVVEANCRRWTADVGIDSRQFRMSLPTLPGRLTLLSLRRRPMVDSDDEQPSASQPPRRSWLDVAVSFLADRTGSTDNWASLLGQEGNTVPPETAEAFRQALTRGRRLVLSDADIMELLNSSSVDPYIGIAGAHLMLDAVEARQNRLAKNQSLRSLDAMRFSETLVRDVCTRLASQFGTTPDVVDGPCDPDLASILLRAGFPIHARKQLTISEPPLYLRSWDALLGSMAREDAIRLDPVLIEELRWSTGLGPYLAWKPRPLAKPRPVRATVLAPADALHSPKPMQVAKARRLQTRQRDNIEQLLEHFEQIDMDTNNDKR